MAETPSNFYYLEMTPKWLQNYFGSASEVLLGTRIVIFDAANARYAYGHGVEPCADSV